MDIILNDVEVRVLGCLIEKSMTTPDYYPLSLHSLTTACNQKSNRNPVVLFEDSVVVRGLNSLKEKRFVVQGDSSRVPKYAEIFVSGQNLLSREAAILMVLFLRGPQTIGELRTRTERSYKFDNVQDVESVLEDLIDSDYVAKLPVQPGRKEPRFGHLLAGEPELEAIAPKLEPATVIVNAENEKINSLIGEVEKLREELSQLKNDFSRFKSEFE